MSDGERQKPTASAFYGTPQGHAIQELLRANIGPTWTNALPERTATLGCGNILLNDPGISARMTGLGEKHFSCLVDSANKPLSDASIDSFISLHPGIDDLAPLIREFWRVLRGEGRLLMIVPRQSSAWAKAPDSPFGSEKAYTMQQIRKVLIENNFYIENIGQALYAPPKLLRTNYPLARSIEIVAPWLIFFFGGVLVVEAQKRVCCAAKAESADRGRRAEAVSALPFPVSGRISESR